MAKRLLLTPVLILIVAALTVSVAAAAPPQQGTLPDPPPGGGVVTVENLIIRAGASTEWRAIGVLSFGEEIIPVGRSADGEWAIFELNPQGDLGWVAEEFIEWHPDLNFQALPVLIPPPTPTVTASPTEEPTSTSTPSAEPTETEAPDTSTAEPTEAPTSSPTPVPPTTIPTATPTEAAAALGPTGAPETAASPIPTLPITGEPSASLGNVPPWAWIAGGGVLLALILYLWRGARARRELRRYSEGFVLETCPVCRVGTLHIDRHVDYQLGVPSVRRIVRCDHCNSVVRQIRPGQWRYAVDPHANPQLAADHDDTRLMTDADLQDFAVHARRYSPDVVAVNPAQAELSPEFEWVVEHLEALEADVIAAREQELNEEENGTEAESAQDEEVPPEDETDVDVS